jgi:polar amino acid transport system substrate-binding protein
VQYVETTWGTVAAGLQSDRFDLMGGFNKTPERALAVDFSRPIGASIYGLLSLADRSQELATWSNVDRKDIRIGAVDGTGAYRTVSKELKNVQWVLAQNVETLLLELDAGRSQLVLVDWIEGRKYVAQRKKGVFITPNPILKTETALAMRKSSDPQLQAALDEIIGNLEKQGHLDRIWVKYLPPAK